jgi:hypothetical protein
MMPHRMQRPRVRREEALIQRAASDGIEIMRRVDQSPASVLGVASRAEQAAVA